MKLAVRIGVALLALILALIGGGLLALRTGWFREKLRQRVVAELENDTGGRVEIARLDFDPQRWHARLEGLTIHGLEGLDQKPLFHARALEIDLKVVSFLEKRVNIAGLRLEGPEIHIQVSPGGSTNIPAPRGSAAGRPVAEELLNLAVGRFELESGSLWWNDRRYALEFAASGLRAQLRFEQAGRYIGQIEAREAQIALPPRIQEINHLAANFQISRDQIEIGSVSGKTALSEFRAHGSITDFSQPHSQFDYDVAADAREAAAMLALPELKGGRVQLKGSVEARGARWSASGKLTGQQLAAAGREFNVRNVSLSGNYRLDPRGISVEPFAARLLGGEWKGRIQADYKGQARVEGRAEGIRLEAAAAAVSSSSFPLSKLGWASVISGTIKARGVWPSLFRSVNVRAELTLAAPADPGGRTPVQGTLRASYQAPTLDLQLDQMQLDTPASSLTASGQLGRASSVQFRVATTRLEELTAAASAVFGEKVEPPVKLEGRAVFVGRASGAMRQPQIDAAVNVSRFVQEGREWDSFTGRVQWSRTRLRLTGGRLTRGATAVYANLMVGLEDGRIEANSPVQGDFSIRDTQIQDLAALARQKTPFQGALTASLRVDGTRQNLRASGDIEIRRGAAWGEPFGDFRAAVVLEPTQVQLSRFQVAKGSSAISGSGMFDHQRSLFRFDVRSEKLALADWQVLEKTGKRVSGSGAFHLSGSGRLRAGETFPEDMALSGDLRLQKLSVDGRPFGALAATVREQGNKLHVQAESDFTGAQIRMSADVVPRDRFPIDGRIEFRNANLSAAFQAVRPVRLPEKVPADGDITISGEARSLASLVLAGTITRLEVPLPQTAAAARIQSLHSPEPVKWRLAGRRLVVEAAHLVGEGTDLRFSGTASLDGPINFGAKGSVNLAVLPGLGPNVDVRGASVIDAAVTGTLRQPDIRGSLEIRDASAGSENLPVSLSNANGTISFSRYSATIQKLTAEAGGGQISFSGDATFLPAQPFTYRVSAEAHQVRLRYPKGLTTVLEAALTFAGTDQQSLLSGDIKVTRFGTRASMDVGALLVALRQPTRTPSRNGWLQGAQLNVAITTAPNIRFETSLARNFQADANLRLRGTVLNPALFGRINIIQGDFEFQGTRYAINRGEVTFSNPFRIEPILNMDLETRVSSYDIVLTLSGPLQKLNVSYRSDPPLPFSEVITLLAVGRAPSTEGTLAAQQNAQAQSLTQLGASTVIGQAIEKPVTGGLQRFFGVSRLKVDPELLGPEGNPNARVTLEQQVSRDVTFTYIYNLASAQEQIVRIQWALSSQLSVIAVRDQNGVFGVDFLYRRRYR
jgi:translocation and assembly module TamB